MPTLPLTVRKAGLPPLSSASELARAKHSRYYSYLSIAREDLLESPYFCIKNTRKETIVTQQQTFVTQQRTFATQQQTVVSQQQTVGYSKTAFVYVKTRHSCVKMV